MNFACSALSLVRRTLPLVATALSLTLATGCTHRPEVAASTVGALFGGHIQGGQQPVTGASIQLYAVGVAGDGSPATPLLPTPAMTDGNGNFTITNQYKCLSTSPNVYLVATGGNPGLGSSVTNSSLAMMAALGPCSALLPTSNVSMNELTTMGSLASLYPYMNSVSALGSGSSDASAFTAAFAAVNEYTNVATGTVPGASLPAGFYASQTEINTLGDILAACINSSGGVAGDGSACGKLFALTTPAGGTAPTDTISAALQILKNPTANAPALYALIPANPPYLPALMAPPATWALPIVPQAATPVISPAGGNYTQNQAVTLTDSTANAAIHYTVDGSIPTVNSATYTTPFAVTATGTVVRAIAMAANYVPSPVASATFNLAPPPGTPVISSVSAFNMAATQTITITGSGFGSKAPFNGTSTSLSVIDATKAFQAGYGSDTVTVSVSSWTDSQIVITGFGGAYGTNFSFGFQDQINLAVFNAQTGGGPGVCDNVIVLSGNVSNVAPTVCSSVAETLPPVFSLASGNYTTAQTVSLSSRTTGASIFYTVDGSVPTSSSTLYTGPITVTTSETINAVATTYTMPPSNVVSATYGINGYGIISTLAGNGVPGYVADNVAAAGSELNYPAGVSTSPSGLVYVADKSNNRIRLVQPGGTISTFTGNGIAAYNGDGLALGGTEVNGPQSVLVDGAGNAYIADTFNHRVRKVTPAGVVSTVAGTGVAGFAGDGGKATLAQLNDPEGLALDNGGNLYIAEYGNGRVRMVTAGGVISTFAGGGTAFADNVAPTQSSLGSPYGVAADGNGNVYIADTFNHRVRKVSGGVITTLAGTGSAAFGGDGGKASLASLSYPEGVAVDSNGNVFIADTFNNRIRLVNAAGVISTVAGSASYGFSGDGGLATSASLNQPTGIAVDGSGNLYFPDYASHHVRMVTYSSQLPAATPTFNLPSASYTTVQLNISIACATAGATIYYTTDGSKPSTASKVYSGAFSVSSTTTVNAIASAPGFNLSSAGSVTYTITNPATATPVVTPAVPSGVLNVVYGQLVTLTDSTNGAVIHYTTDGTTASSASPVYTGPFAITAPYGTSVSAIAVAPGYQVSGAVSAVYYVGQTQPPTFSPSINNIYPGSVTIYISPGVPGAAIYYTLDGSHPTTSSQQYFGPFVLTKTTFVLAVDITSGNAPSAATGGYYQVQ